MVSMLGNYLRSFKINQCIKLEPAITHDLGVSSFVRDKLFGTFAFGSFPFTYLLMVLQNNKYRI